MYITIWLLFCKTPGAIHLVPPFVVYAKPASRKLDATVSNCRQPMLILFELLGSMQMDGSFAARLVKAN